MGDPFSGTVRRAGVPRTTSTRRHKRKSPYRLSLRIGQAALLQSDVALTRAGRPV